MQSSTNRPLYGFDRERLSRNLRIWSPLNEDSGASKTTSASVASCSKGRQPIRNPLGYVPSQSSNPAISCLPNSDHSVALVRGPATAATTGSDANTSLSGRFVISSSRSGQRGRSLD